MRNKLTSAISIAVLAFAMVASANAAPVILSFDEVGELSEATFGGSGIPNSQVAQTVFEGPAIQTGTRPRPGPTITLGLSAHGRYENVLDGTDGAGTYYASTGSNTPPGSSIEGATWNFNYFIDIDGGTFGIPLDFNLYYDFDSAVGNDLSTHGVLNIADAFALFQIPPVSQTRVEGSENLLFGFLGASSSFITAPSSVTAFDPNAEGEYTFALVASDSQGAEVARTAIRVVVESVQVPEPSTLAIFALGMIGLAARRFKKQA